jgi:hypothetical protein
MKAQSIVMAVCSLLSLAAAPAAQACEFKRTPWGLQVTNCKLGDLYPGRYSAVLEVLPFRPIVNLPNLVVTDVDARTFGGIEAEVTVDVTNNGIRNAGAFDVIVITTVNDPNNNNAQVSMTPFGPVSIASLAVGAIATKYMGIAVLPNRAQDWDVCSVAIVDPVANGGQPWGSAWESNESDNQWGSTCQRVFASSVR